jgi:hypothetical protein
MPAERQTLAQGNYLTNPIELGLIFRLKPGSCVLAGAGGLRCEPAIVNLERTNLMTSQCLACGARPAVIPTNPKWPALCAPCLGRAGDDIGPGARVLCTVSNGCSGTVDRLVDDDQLVVVRTEDGKEAWVPIQEMVRVTC